MRSDTIMVSSSGAGIADALKTAERVAEYKGLAKKDALQLRLLTEELMGMLRGLTGEKDAKFYIEDDKNDYRIHLVTETAMDAEKRRKLLSSSTSGKNAAVTGVMSKIRDLFQQAFEPLDDDLPSYYTAGWVGYDIDPAAADFAFQDHTWSFNRYRDSITRENNTEEWDELEKSIVANLADEISIGINKNKVEMIIFKKFGGKK
ncbi:MAG: hypothetical protein J5854_00615 [Clostridia bacterium]|nr:hypothetical protein [Clostridia bacterium]